MAIPINVNKTKIDRDTNKFIGLRLPLIKSDGREGYFQSTSLTVDAVKEDIKSLVKTSKGQRVFQPDLGMGLNRLLFENITDDLKLLINDDIINTFKVWLPFITIKDVSIFTSDDDGIGTFNNINDNTVSISITFFMNNSPNMLESVDVVLGENNA